MQLLRILKNWTLPLAMLAGVVLYFLYANIPFLAPTKPFALQTILIVQPVLIFAMLFVTFCKVSPRDLHWCAWHGWLLLFQGCSFALLVGVAVFFQHAAWRVLLEGAMLCLICPTATAAAVVTGRLGGNAATLTAYTIFSNILTAILVPLLVPCLHMTASVGFADLFGRIIARVFPMLICPLLAAWALRYWMPRWHAALLRATDLAFYLWAVTLMSAIALTTRSIVHSTLPFWIEASVAGVSLVCCAVQFALGKFIGAHCDDRISAGQALGQKNTVFAIWLGYSFFNPITALAGGFYTVWHNVFNSYQLWRMGKYGHL